MKKYIINIVIMTILLGNQGYANFEDTRSHEYKDAIQQLVDMNIVQGYPGNVFKPDQGITRAEMLKILMIGAGVSLQTDFTNCFPDVKSADRYRDYVCTAKSMGIVAGYDDGTFQPNKVVSNVEGIKIALKSFDVNPRLEGRQKNRYDMYMNFVHDNSIFSRYNIYPNSVMTRGMMTHLTTTIINQGTQSRSYIRQNNSLGCKAPQPNSTPTSVTINGVQRSIITDIGINYNQSQPTKLIVAFHGRTNPNTLIRTYYKIDKASDGNTIIVYPAGLPEEGPTRSWQNPGDKPNNLRDYALFDKIVQEFSEEYCIDKDEIYVVGHSLGGWFTNTLACARGNIIRGIGSVGGSITARTTCTGPTSVIIMHHPEDNLASFAGGESARNALLTQNQCDINTTESTGPEGGNCLKYTNCIAGSKVVRCPHSDSTENGRYYPHTRPDFAGKAIRDFFTDRI